MEKRVEAVITKKQKVNHDCYIFSYQFVGEKIEFTIGSYFKIIKTLPTFDHPEGEELQKKYTPINPCSQTVALDLGRTPLTSLSKYTDPTHIPISLKEADTHPSLKLKKLETSSLFKDLSEGSATKLEAWSPSVFQD